MARNRRNELETGRVILRDPNVHGGSLLFAGSMVPVEVLIDYLKCARSIDDFLDGYPAVKRWQVEAFLDLYSEAVDNLVTHSTRATSG